MSASAQKLSFKQGRAQALATALPHALWCGDALGSYASATISSGYSILDRELPGGGWPSSALTELLWAQPGSGEFRLLAPALSRLAGEGKRLVVLAPPYLPCAPALAQLGIELRQLLLVQSEKLADRLWASEQVIKSSSFGALLCWLPQARPDHLRRLQLAAAGCEGLVFVCRSETARLESSPAPLRLACRTAIDGQVAVDVFKRRGPAAQAPVLVPVRCTPLLARALRLAREADLPLAHPSLPLTHVDRSLSTSTPSGPRVSALA